MQIFYLRKIVVVDLFDKRCACVGNRQYTKLWHSYHFWTVTLLIIYFKRIVSVTHIQFSRPEILTTKYLCNMKSLQKIYFCVCVCFCF